MKTAALSLVTVAALSGTVACSSSAATDAAGAPAAVVNVADAQVIDVRTPSEFASGHLEGATNINVEGGDFAAQLATLDKNASYVVYCRSGNRSADAVAKMNAAGFTNVLDAGGVQEAADSTGLPVVP